MNLIGVISDTHRILPSRALDIFRGDYERSQVIETLTLVEPDAEISNHQVDSIIHAGDIGDSDSSQQRILDQLAEVAPVHAVLGNCDAKGYFADNRDITEGALSLDIDGLSIVVAHEPKTLSDFISMSPTTPDLRIHGHLHKYAIHCDDGSVLLCPGSIHDPRNEMGYRTVSLVHAEQGKIVQVDIVRL